MLTQFMFLLGLGFTFTMFNISGIYPPSSLHSCSSCATIFSKRVVANSHRKLRANFLSVFRSFWGRCLLWRRANDVRFLTRTPPGEHTIRMPPSWSWMAYEGGISYIEPPGDSVLWNDPDIILPLRNSNHVSWLRTSGQYDSLEIRVSRAYAFDVPSDTLESEAQLFYDNGIALPFLETKCVVIGRERERTDESISSSTFGLKLNERYSSFGGRL